jgi:glycine/D-amino acid oxidase-like deaminating enzyme
MRTERARVQMNTACGAKTVMVSPAELKELVPQVDLTGGGRYPVLGASHHPQGATARHDRVAWAFASGAARRRAYPPNRMIALVRLGWVAAKSTHSDAPSDTPNNAARSEPTASHTAWTAMP